MTDTIFEMMERTRIVDRTLFWVAVLGPLFVSGLAFVFRQEKFVTRQRHRWVLAILAAPAVLILWKTYNAVVDRYGLDSVRGLLINAAIFAVTALIFTGLKIILKALITEPPPPPAITQRIPSQRFTTARMRSISAGMNPDAPAPPCSRPATATSSAASGKPRLMYEDEYLEYIELFNERYFYDCHEALEEIWLDCFGPPRRYYQGLIHLATAYQLLLRGKLPGSRARFASALEYLNEYPDIYLGLDLTALRQNASLWLARLNAAPAGTTTPYRDSDVPTLTLLNSQQ